MSKQKPHYNVETHYRDIFNAEYYKYLLVLRHKLFQYINTFWNNKGALHTDLFMLTPSVSSPFGPGSDSEPIKIKFGNLDTFLVDSSQFGFEPLLMQDDIDMLYCYLPSMRGEDPDERHLNQFYHCEVEANMGFKAMLDLIEEFIRYIAFKLLENDIDILDTISQNIGASKIFLENLINKKWLRVSFDEAVDILSTSFSSEELFNSTDSGRDITAQGELKLLRALNVDTPVWVMFYDRDRVPFYQKPDPENQNKVLNADLLFPPIHKNSFGGEIVGMGQRQDNAREMYESLNRQGIDFEPYEWYIDLRRDKKYKTSSGFGLGIERFISWILGLDDIKHAIHYPRLKNIKTFP